MKQKVKVDEAEMKALSDVIPVNVLLDTKKLTAYAKEHNLTPIQVAQIVTYTTIRFPELRIIDIDEGNQLTFGELFEFYERARLNFIVVRRVNFLVHQSMIDVYDLLEKENRLRFGVKKHSKDAEKVWNTYDKALRKQLNNDTWCALQDHFVVVEGMLESRIEKIYTTIRDHLIQGGVQDIEVKGRIELVLLMMKCARHSFVGFFQEFKDACGADFSKCFELADMALMTKSFIRMVEALGIKVEQDKFGLFDLVDVNISKGLRISWAWDDFIAVLRNDELMNEAALTAIGYNPTVEEEYHKVLEEENQKALDEGLDKLSEKFKVTKQK